MEPWPIAWSGEGGASRWDERLVELAVSVATTQLAALTGGRYGISTYTEGYRLPGGGGCLPYPSKGVDGEWRNVHGGSVCCSIALEHQPVQSVTSVRVWGELDTGYVVERGTLRRLGGCWPTGDGCADPPIVVVYRAGVRPPLSGALALGELAQEYAEALSGHECRLPSSVVSVARQGVTYDLASPETLAVLKRTGLPLVDAFIDAVNTSRLQARSRVYSPDLPQRVS